MAVSSDNATLISR